MNDFDKRIACEFEQGLHSDGVEIIQVNVGLKCNQECLHCHVAASPRREEAMPWDTMQAILEAARKVRPHTIDITGGAPELNPYFRRFVPAARDEGYEVMVRTNLTVLLTSGMETMPEFFRDHRVHLIASLPCYLEENVDRQRGHGAYAASVKAIKRLNALGYSSDPQLPLDLVYNPLGPYLPPEQPSLEADYKRELKHRYGIVFSRLLTIANMPIGRFMADLQRQGKCVEYLRLLRDSFNPFTLDGLMCRRQLSVGWDGRLYDCDFNLAIRMPVDHGIPTHIRDFDPAIHAKRRIATADHCFGCTAGSGSSCGGALVEGEGAQRQEPKSSKRCEEP